MSKDSLITITYADETLLSDSNGDIIGNDPSDYVEVYYFISKNIIENKKKSVIVRDITLFNWLRPTTKIFGVENVGTYKMTYRNQLSRLWDIQIPDYVTDNEIYELGLLEIVRIPSANMNYSDVLLSHFLSSSFANKRFIIEEICEFLTSVNFENWQQSMRYSAIIRELSKKIEQWLKNENDENTQQIIDMIAENPFDLKDNLVLYKIVKNYPEELGMLILKEKFKIFQSLPMDLHNLEINESSIKPAVPQIEMFFHNISLYK